MRRTFTRRNGERVTVEIEIDMEKLIEDMAHKLARQGATRITKAGGSIIATVVENA
jgi:hypothetical protein